MKAKKLEEWDSIEREFFKIDEEEKTAKIVMQYDSAEDWIDSTCLTDTPLISTEVLNQIRSVFGLAPPKYKVYGDADGRHPEKEPDHRTEGQSQ